MRKWVGRMGADCSENLFFCREVAPSTHAQSVEVEGGWGWVTDEGRSRLCFRGRCTPWGWGSVPEEWCQRRKGSVGDAKIESDVKIKDQKEDARLRDWSDSEGKGDRGSEDKRVKGRVLQCRRKQTHGNGQNISNIPDCVFMCVLQTSKYSEQMCLHETGCQPPQEESKTFIFPIIRHDLNELFIAVWLNMFLSCESTLCLHCYSWFEAGGQ